MDVSLLVVVVFVVVVRRKHLDGVVVHYLGLLRGAERVVCVLGGRMGNGESVLVVVGFVGVLDLSFGQLVVLLVDGSWVRG